MNLIKVMFFAFLTLQFISCDNEPLTGEFPQDDDNNAEIGQFKALVEGEQFVAATTSATLSLDNKLTISGTKVGGEKISLEILNASVGTFELNTDLNFGSYSDTSSSLPYISSEVFGGSGQLKISEIDTTELTMSGTFKFVGLRVKVDSNGDPVLDGNGDAVLETVEITKGSFNKIPYIEDGSGSNSGNPLDQFFAKVDGVEFAADSISITEPVIGNVKMLKVEAFNADGAKMRIDIPKSIGLGTFNFENISDGTKLIALYNAGGGSENLTSHPGAITITEIDLVEGVLKATFSFRANDPLGQVPDVVVVTEGRFTANFEGVEGGNDTFSAKVGTRNYNPLEMEVSTSVVNQYPTITISTSLEGQSMVLTFPATITEGSFEMGTEVIEGNEIVGFYNPDVGASIDYISNPGTLTITNYNLQENTIAGTFSFNAIDLSGDDNTIYRITQGAFYIELP